MKTKTFRNPDLGGMDERFRADPTTALSIRNMRRDTRGAWANSLGYTPVQPLAQVGALGPIRSLHWFGQHNNARNFLVFEMVIGSTVTLNYWNFGQAVPGPTLIQADRRLVEGPTPGTTYFEWGNWLYVFNGYDAPIRYNARETVRVGFDAPPPPPVLEAGPTDQMAADYITGVFFSPIDQRGVGVASGSPEFWRYGYAFTWVSDQGHESPISPTVFIASENEKLGNALVGPGLRSVLLKSEPGPPNARGIRIYRTINVQDVETVGEQGFTLYFHSEHRTAGPLFVIDDHPDRELGLPFDPFSVGEFPRGVRFATIFKNTLFCDAGSEYPDRIRFSHPGKIEQMPPGNLLPIGDRAAGQPTGIRSTKNAIVVFKKRGIYLIKGDPLNGFYSETLSEDEGSSSARALVEIPGIGLLHLDDDGPHVLLGALENTATPTRTEFIGGPIHDTWKKRVNISALANAHAVVNHVDREVWIQVPADGDDRPNLGLVYHYDIGMWSIREVGTYPAAAFAESKLTGELFFGSFAEVAHEGLFVYNDVLDGDGSNIVATYETAWLNFEERTQVLHLTPFVVAYDRPIPISVRVDREITYIDVSETDHESRDAEHERDVWGTAEWGASAVWDDYVPVHVRVDLHQINAFEASFRLQSDRIMLVSYDLGIVDRAVPNIKHLSQLQG